MPENGTSIQQGESIAGIESVKTAADVYAPCDCEVTDSNSRMSGEPELLNADPENEGWIVRFTFSDGSKLEKLMDQSSYDEFVKDN